MPLNLSDVHAKLDWAEHLADLLYKEMTSWGNNPASFRIERVKRQDAGHQVVEMTVRFGIKPDLVRWSLMFGDFVHNTRAALDYLVFAIARFEAGNTALSPRVERVLSMPICDSPERWRERSFAIKALSPDMQAKIEGIQPFNRPDSKMALSVLRDFNDADKHRLLTTSVVQPYESKMEFKKAVDSPREIAWNARGGDVVDGTVFLRIAVEGNLDEVDVDCETDFDVVVKHPYQKWQGNIGIVMDRIHHEAQEVIKIIAGE